MRQWSKRGFPFRRIVFQELIQRNIILFFLYRNSGGDAKASPFLQFFSSINPNLRCRLQKRGGQNVSQNDCADPDRSITAHDGRRGGLHYLGGL